VTWEVYRRLEPMPPYTELQRGFAAEVADPLWLLGRQWQVGEHAGEDASSPVLVELDVAHTPLEPVAGMDPAVVPAEALLEGRPRTGGRSAAGADRPRCGRRVDGGPARGDVVRDAARAVRRRLRRGGRRPGGLAGRLIEPDSAALSGFALRPDFWQPELLTHAATVPVGGVELTVTGHDGGDVDWYTADATGPLAAPAFARRQVIPQRLQYPGAPAPRWWQIEDGAVDIGGFPPDRSHLATALLIELVCGHANDWFTLPVPSPAPPEDGPPPPSSGVVVSIGTARVKDGFDDWWDLTIPPGRRRPAGRPDEAPGPWSLFRTAGLDRSSLVVWPTATTPLSGPALDDVILGVDEDANLMWAVELTVDGLALLLSPDSSAALAETRRSGSRDFTWRPSTTLPEHWHPYRIESRPAPQRRVFVQGLVADLSAGPDAGTRESARSELLGAGAGTSWPRAPYRIRAFGSNAATHSPAAPTAGRCSGGSGGACRFSADRSHICASTCSRRVARPCQLVRVRRTTLCSAAFGVGNRLAARALGCRCAVSVRPPLLRPTPESAARSSSRTTASRRSGLARFACSSRSQISSSGDFGSKYASTPIASSAPADIGKQSLQPG
jgi:hypothetical protein